MSLKAESSRLKRLPENSHTIMIKFAKKSHRDECVNLAEFKNIIGELAALVTKYNSTFEIFAWDILSGTSIDIDTPEIIK